MQNWIGGSHRNPIDAYFVPPEPTAVPVLMEDLVTYLAIPGVLLIIASFSILATSVAAALLVALVGIAWLIVSTVVVAALSGIYQTALYRFSVDGVVPVAFADADLAHAFRHR
ncbi:hypothetical protein [Nocardia mangyaensis]|uniref:hypothetical protein n=1 Tax=Nocardia mangyaensis TaxID=2213200 RepID=UPI0026765502|nr:hypothetical protein [Nocardia mangyaensis]MDO3650455.1 hypothetical protein [Nocardia mangyaensis]